MRSYTDKVFIVTNGMSRTGADWVCVFRVGWGRGRACGYRGGGRGFRKRRRCHGFLHATGCQEAGTGYNRQELKESFHMFLV